MGTALAIVLGIIAFVVGIVLLRFLALLLIAILVSDKGVGILFWAGEVLIIPLSIVLGNLIPIDIKEAPFLSSNFGSIFMLMLLGSLFWFVFVMIVSAVTRVFFDTTEKAKQPPSDTLITARNLAILSDTTRSEKTEPSLPESHSP